MKRRIFILLLISTITLLVVWYWIGTYENINDTMWKLQSNLVEKETTISEINEVQVHQFNSEHQNIDWRILEKIPKNSCVIRLHDNICLDCYAECIIRLKSEAENCLRLFILGSYHYSATLKDIILSLGLNSIKFENIPNNCILPADSCGKPYTFFIDDEGYTKHVFIFRKKDYTTIKSYVKLLQRENSKCLDDEVYNGTCKGIRQTYYMGYSPVRECYVGAGYGCSF